MVSARRFRDLQVSEGELTPVQPIEAPVRQIQAPELVERAPGRPTIAELVEAGRRAPSSSWSDDEDRKQA